MMLTRLYQSYFLTIMASSRANLTVSLKGSLAVAFCQSSSCFRHTTHAESPKNIRFLHNIVQDGAAARSIMTRKMSFGFGDEDAVPRIPREAMEEIIEDVANGGREDSGYVIIDVRGHDEVAQTGKLDEVVHTLPLPYIADGALSMDEDDFEEQFGFVKPSLDETLVFTCKAGIRSASAAKLAQMAGYTDILDYAGGSNEWFS